MRTDFSKIWFGNKAQTSFKASKDGTYIDVNSPVPAMTPGQSQITVNVRIQVDDEGHHFSNSVTATYFRLFVNSISVKCICNSTQYCLSNNDIVQQNNGRIIQHTDPMLIEINPWFNDDFRINVNVSRQYGEIFTNLYQAVIDEGIEHKWSLKIGISTIAASEAWDNLDGTFYCSISRETLYSIIEKHYSADLELYWVIQEHENLISKIEILESIRILGADSNIIHKDSSMWVNLQVLYNSVSSVANTLNYYIFDESD